MSLFTVFMPRIAAELLERGFKIISTEPSKKNPQFQVYRFEDTPELQLALKQILQKK